MSHIKINIFLLCTLFFFSNSVCGQIFENINVSKSFDNKITVEAQTSKLFTSADIAALSSRGVTVEAFLGTNKYLLTVPTTFSKYNGDASILSFSERKKPMNFDRASNPLPDWSYKDHNAFLLIQMGSGYDRAKCVQAIIDLGGTIIKDNKFNDVLEIRVAETLLKRLIDIPFILNVEPINRPPLPDDKLGRNLHRVNKLNNPLKNRNYTGEGVNILVRDDGALFEHIDLRGRTDQSSVGESRGDHGDGVAGIFVGAGNLDPDARGMAYGSYAYVLDYDASFLDNTMDLVRNNAVRITNSSYSDGCNAGYTSTTRTVDQQMRLYPTLLHVFSAGNAGEDDCGYGAGATWGNITGGHKIGKNVIAVANLGSLGDLVSTSSRGPAFDGRIKPDIAANGQGHISLEEKQGYAPFGGTSGAAPVVAGVSAMLYEAHQKLFSTLPEAALIKTLMLNTADDSGKPGPDFKYGWGVLNAHKAALALEESRFEKLMISQEQVINVTIPAPPSGTSGLKVMTYWVDREGTTDEFLHLVNDITTTIEDVDTTYMPFVLDPSNNAASLNTAAITGVEGKNNVEQIYITNPDTRDYTLNIYGERLPFGNATAYVTWEYISDQIDIVYPNGTESLIKGDREYVQWDALSNDGEFLIEIFESNVVIVSSRTVDGGARYFNMQLPTNYNDDLKVRISRDGISDESDTTFLVSDAILGLRVERDETTRDVQLLWTNVSNAAYYNIYVLGDKYMEVRETSMSNSFILPNIPEFKTGWIAVSPVFDNDKEGKRSKAILMRPAPVAKPINDKQDTPCINEEIVFSVPDVDTLTSYTWKFGNDATPLEAEGPGPHTVTYSRRGNKTGYLQVINETGDDAQIFKIAVQRDPEGSSITESNTGGGNYSFTSNHNYIDSVVWDLSGITKIGKTVEHQYATGGIKNILATGISRCGEKIVSKEVLILGTVAIDETEPNKIHIAVFPNPNSGSFIVNSSEKFSIENLSLINANGSFETSYVAKSISDYSAYIEGLKKGIYILSINIDGSIHYEKIVIE